MQWYFSFNFSMQPRTFNYNWWSHTNINTTKLATIYKIFIFWFCDFWAGYIKLLILLTRRGIGRIVFGVSKYDCLAVVWVSRNYDNTTHWMLAGGRAGNGYTGFVGGLWPHRRQLPVSGVPTTLRLRQCQFLKQASESENIFSCVLLSNFQTLSEWIQLEISDIFKNIVGVKERFCVSQICSKLLNFRLKVKC